MGAGTAAEQDSQLEILIQEVPLFWTVRIKNPVLTLCRTSACENFVSPRYVTNHSRVYCLILLPPGGTSCMFTETPSEIWDQRNYKIKKRTGDHGSH